MTDRMPGQFSMSNPLRVEIKATKRCLFKTFTFESTHLSISFNFHAVFGKYWQKIDQRSELAIPPTGKSWILDCLLREILEIPVHAAEDPCNGAFTGIPGPVEDPGSSRRGSSTLKFRVQTSYLAKVFPKNCMKITGVGPSGLAQALRPFRSTNAPSLLFPVPCVRTRCRMCWCCWGPGWCSGSGARCSGTVRLSAASSRSWWVRASPPAHHIYTLKI